MDNASRPSFLARHEFLLLRLHSLSGLIPVGAYMVVHLITNASVLNGPATFQRAVYQIHSLGAVLPIVEWTFIFIPILFHGIVGLVIIRGGLPNSGTYAYTSNIRYTLQRATGLIAFAFIGWHVFHMHGWIHAEWWTNQIGQFGALFRPYNAASTAGAAMQQSLIVPALYFIGVTACVFHLANGIWTMGITWGIWITPAAQARANWIALGVGAVLMAVSMGALYGFSFKVDVEQAAEIENEMYEAAAKAHWIDPNEHKRSHAAHPAVNEQAAQASEGEQEPHTGAPQE